LWFAGEEPTLPGEEVRHDRKPFHLLGNRHRRLLPPGRLPFRRPWRHAAEGPAHREDQMLRYSEGKMIAIVIIILAFIVIGGLVYCIIRSGRE